MQTLSIRQDLISRLIQLNKKNKFLLPDDTSNVDWASVKTSFQDNLSKLKYGVRIFEILAYILLAITAVMSFIKVMGETTWPDLNKGALLILLTVTNAFTAFTQKIRIERLEKQILLLDILEKMDVGKD